MKEDWMCGLELLYSFEFALHKKHLLMEPRLAKRRLQTYDQQLHKVGKG